MRDKILENIIKDIFKDLALHLHELNDEDRKSLLAEFSEWIHEDLEKEKILMLPYEAYTLRVKKFFKQD